MGVLHITNGMPLGKCADLIITAECLCRTPHFMAFYFKHHIVFELFVLYFTAKTILYLDYYSGLRVIV